VLQKELHQWCLEQQGQQRQLLPEAQAALASVQEGPAGTAEQGAREQATGVLELQQLYVPASPRVVAGSARKVLLGLPQGMQERQQAERTYGTDRLAQLQTVLPKLRALREEAAVRPARVQTGSAE